MAGVTRAFTRDPEPEVNQKPSPELFPLGYRDTSGAFVPVDNDPVNHPSHYTAYKGVEVIDLTEQMNFNRGNAVKYICRAGLKNPEDEVQDLEKARWYIDREIERIKKA